MPFRRWSIAWAVVGILLVVAAVVLRFVLVPIATRLPGDTDLTVHYQGTANLLDSKALQAGKASSALRSHLPITVDRRVQVLSTAGDTAVVSDALTVHAPGQELPSSYLYAVDRSTLKGVTPPAGKKTEPATGALTSAFPLHPKSDSSYTYYDPATRTIVPMTYAGHDTRGGRSVNVYRISPSGAVRNPDLLASLPPALPKSLVVGLAPLLPAGVRAALTPATVAALPDPIPLTYTGTSAIVAYVDRQTGVAIDETISQQVIVNVTVGGRTVSLLPVVALDFHITPASIADLADKAKSAGLLLILVGLVAPLVLLVLGLALIVLAVLRERRVLRALLGVLLRRQGPGGPARGGAGSADGVRPVNGTRPAGDGEPAGNIGDDGSGDARRTTPQSARSLD
ncbi:porin PorA family protein [Frankia tisae]|uniref:porin PorA family protein n=1 Tax=Frankia tisae TaxID=2950104 RepID=UPI0021C124BD|nr:porin PorA family protein [Frankia tisae]